MPHINLPTINCKQVSDEIGDFVVQSVHKVNATGCVIGLSGGIDSSTTAYLIQNTFRQYNLKENKTLELVGYILPSNLNSREDSSYGISVAKELRIRFEVIPIEEIIHSFRTVIPEIFDNHFHIGNLVSRIRANILATKSAKENKILAGTGNKDEDFGIGYYTLFGDGAVHISPIGGLSKRLVYQMASFLGVPTEVITRTPTAGLEPNQSDFKDLGYDYDIVEMIMEGLIQNFEENQLKKDPYVQKKCMEQIDRYENFFGVKKFSSVSSIIDDIIRRHHMAKSKAMIIHPPQPEITLNYE